MESKKEILEKLSLSSSYDLEDSKFIVKEELFNKIIFDSLNIQNSIFNTGVTRGVIYASCIVFIVENINFFSGINFEYFFSFLKSKKILLTPTEQSKFLRNKTIVCSYIKDFKQLLSNGNLTASKSFAVFGSKTGYETIGPNIVQNLQEIFYTRNINDDRIMSNKLLKEFEYKNNKHIFEISPFTINYILKTFSEGDELQVAKDLLRMSVYINNKSYLYKENKNNKNNVKEVYNKFVNDLNANGIKNLNALNFLKKYAHQGALLGGWSMILMEPLGMKEGFLFHNTSKMILNITFIDKNAIKILCIYPFSVRNMNLADLAKLKFSNYISFFFEGSYRFPEFSNSNEVKIFDLTIGLLCASQNNVHDVNIINKCKNVFSETNKLKCFPKDPRGGDRKLNTTNFEILV